MDAQLQLAQKHHLIFGFDLFWPTKHMAMMQPEFCHRLCAELGKRYASVPGMIFYMFDDGGVSYTRLQSFRDWTKNNVDGLYSSGRKYVVFAEVSGAPCSGTAAKRCPCRQTATLTRACGLLPRHGYAGGWEELPPLRVRC